MKMTSDTTHKAKFNKVTLFPFWGGGSTDVQKRGVLTDIEIRKIQRFIKEHYLEMYEMWEIDSDNGFYGE